MLKASAKCACGAVAAGTARFAWKSQTDPIAVVWDLDGTLISSHFTPEAARHLNVVSRVDSLRPEFVRASDSFVHYDDDFARPPGATTNTRTFVRPFVRQTLSALSGFTAAQYVCTRAQESYCAHVMRELDPHARLFTSVEGGGASEDSDLTRFLDERALRRTVFLDDHVPNFAKQPRNGVRVRSFDDPAREQGVTEALRVVAICALCTLAKDVRPVLAIFQNAEHRALCCDCP